MLKNLEKRRTVLQQLRKRLDGNASLNSKDGIMYIRYLALLVGMEIQIEGHEKGRSGKRPV